MRYVCMNMYHIVTVLLKRCFVELCTSCNVYYAPGGVDMAMGKCLNICLVNSVAEFRVVEILQQRPFNRWN